MQLVSICPGIRLVNRARLLIILKIPPQLHCFNTEITTNCLILQKYFALRNFRKLLRKVDINKTNFVHVDAGLFCDVISHNNGMNDTVRIVANFTARAKRYIRTSISISFRTMFTTCHERRIFSLYTIYFLFSVALHFHIDIHDIGVLWFYKWLDKLSNVILNTLLFHKLTTIAL